ncbi:hypothetical protein NA57DRAFT_74181 [Rhizodiscina lignyota]|uniref:Mediator of RNA polymerase II transcription subunit 18 n=1 Tax=Rhizodiscina lignyota TaxID=1504668 RepID=A0A9P4ILF1_9PEZI|nr:hypothetical protein NA57DRAFT_74181 [Rhizodiscina lignyota]
MHEVLLFGQVPWGRHEQVLKILAGLCAMQPQRVIERHAVYKPSQAPTQQRGVQVGGSQTIQQQQRPNRDRPVQSTELFYVQAIQSLEESDLGDKIPNGSETNGTTNVMKKQSWAMQFQDVPQPGKRAVILRQTTKSKIVDGDAHEFMVTQGNTFITEFMTEGYQFVTGNIVLNMYRPLQFHPTESVLSSPREALPPLDSLQPLDESGAYLLEASILLGSELKPEIETQGTNELRDLQARMKGVVTLKVPERLSLDTRVK